MTGLIQLFIHQLRIEALYHHIHGVRLGVAVLIVHKVHAVALQLPVKGLGAGQVHGGAGMALVQVHAGGHAGGKDVLRLAGEAQAAEPGDVVGAGSGRVVGKVDVFFPEAGQIIHQRNGAFIHLVPQVEGAVHVKQEQLHIFQFTRIHWYHSPSSSAQARAQRTALCQPFSFSVRFCSSMAGAKTLSMAQLLRISSRLSQ